MELQTHEPAGTEVHDAPARPRSREHVSESAELSVITPAHRQAPQVGRERLSGFFQAPRQRHAGRIAKLGEEAKARVVRESPRRFREGESDGALEGDVGGSVRGEDLAGEPLASDDRHREKQYQAFHRPFPRPPTAHDS